MHMTMQLLAVDPHQAHCHSVGHLTWLDGRLPPGHLALPVLTISNHMTKQRCYTQPPMAILLRLVLCHRYQEVLATSLRVSTDRLTQRLIVT